MDKVYSHVAAYVIIDVMWTTDDVTRQIVWGLEEEGAFQTLPRLYTDFHSLTQRARRNDY